MRYVQENVVYGVRNLDGLPVMITCFRTEMRFNAKGLTICQSFSTIKETADPRNHCIKVLETIPSPTREDEFMMVQPDLPLVTDFRPRTVGEAVAIFAQLAEVSWHVC